MLNIAKLNSECTGMYLEKYGDNYVWQQVFGYITTSSEKVIVEELGAAYINCDVEIHTHTNGIQTAKILVGSEVTMVDGSFGVARIGDEVGGIPRFKDGKITGNLSLKCFSN